MSNNTDIKEVFRRIAEFNFDRAEKFTESSAEDKRLEVEVLDLIMAALEPCFQYVTNEDRGSGSSADSFGEVLKPRCCRRLLVSCGRDFSGQDNSLWIVDRVGDSDKHQFFLECIPPAHIGHATGRKDHVVSTKKAIESYGLKNIAGGIANAFERLMDEVDKGEPKLEKRLKMLKSVLQTLKE